MKYAGSIRPRLVMLLVALMVVWLYADQNLVAPMLIVLRREGMIIGTEETWYYFAGLLATVPLISGLATSAIWGYLTDKLRSRRKLFTLTVLVGEVPCFLSGLARNYYELLFLRSLTGIGLAGVEPVGRAITADLYPPEKRGRGYALFEFGMGFGIMFGMLLAGIFVGMGYSWRLPFVIAALPNFLLAPLFLKLVGEIRVGSGEPEIERLYKLGGDYTYTINIREFVKAFATTPTILFAYLQGVPGTIPWSSLSYWGPSYLREAWGLSEVASTLVVLAVGASMLTGVVVSGYLSDLLLRSGFTMSRVAVSMAGIALSVVAVYTVLSYPYPRGDESPSALIPLLVLVYALSIVLSFASPNVYAILSEVSLPEHRGTLFSVFYVTNRAGSAIGPLVAGAFMAYYYSTGLPRPYNMYYALITATMFWIPCLALWTPLLRTYNEDRKKARNALSARVTTLVEGHRL